MDIYSDIYSLVEHYKHLSVRDNNCQPYNRDPSDYPVLVEIDGIYQLIYETYVVKELNQIYIFTERIYDEDEGFKQRWCILEPNDSVFNTELLNDLDNYRLTLQLDLSKKGIDSFNDFKDFDKVLVRNKINEKWTPGIFIDKVNDEYLVSNGNLYKYCIFYKEKLSHKYDIPEDEKYINNLVYSLEQYTNVLGEIYYSKPRLSLYIGNGICYNGGFHNPSIIFTEDYKTILKDTYSILNKDMEKVFSDLVNKYNHFNESEFSYLIARFNDIVVKNNPF